ncbi:MAG: cytochrome C oxidase subunit IV family protein [Bacteroidales bacterium]
MENSSHHIVPYRVYLVVLAVLIAMTGISVAVTQIDLGAVTIAIALLLATVKSTLVLIYFMHLKFENRMFSFMVAGVTLLTGVVIFVTFLDYLFR